jgi:hypothetical protein
MFFVPQRKFVELLLDGFAVRIQIGDIFIAGADANDDIAEFLNESTGKGIDLLQLLAGKGGADFIPALLEQMLEYPDVAERAIQIFFLFPLNIFFHGRLHGQDFRADAVGNAQFA